MITVHGKKAVRTPAFLGISMKKSRHSDLSMHQFFKTIETLQLLCFLPQSLFSEQIKMSGSVLCEKETLCYTLSLHVFQQSMKDL